MAVVPVPRDDFTVTRTRLRIGSKHILLTCHETQFNYVLYFGGRDFYCINALIPKLDSPLAARFDPSIGCLPNIYYNVNCSLEGGFRRGVDTTMLIKLAISYIKKTYPYVKLLKFNDSSSRECDSDGKVELPELGLITTGKTWYETHFGAQKEAETNAKIKQANEAISKLKRELSWDEFKSVILSPFPRPETELKTAYEKAETIQEFFLWLRGEIGVPEFCIFMAPWLHSFFSNHVRPCVLNLPYTLPIQDTPIEPVEYEESPFCGGGKRPTRRAPKMKYDNSV